MEDSAFLPGLSVLVPSLEMRSLLVEFEQGVVDPPPLAILSPSGLTRSIVRSCEEPTKISDICT